jgi:hypothetical protein
VQVSDIDNATGGSNYTDYTHLSTTMDIGAGYQITVTNAYPYDQYDLCGVWVDWNQDEDFDDAAEAISISPDQTQPGGGVTTFVGTIAPPADFDHDSDVDNNDLDIFSSHRLEHIPNGYQPLEGNLNGDERVNFADFAFFAAGWATSP